MILPELPESLPLPQPASTSTAADSAAAAPSSRGRLIDDVFIDDVLIDVSSQTRYQERKRWCAGHRSGWTPPPGLPDCV
ncbi:hypothetical protein Raf01_88030 [Rugosimonospora africana]|uniref:Uncharacterized protein n=1 Tax=Rugosimonospora africana TaxID=556532 RepID=A0A8J3R5Y7_9ACTN|nr:hypothetical protein Raf01_88030 [Rugosimonospora africana]